MNSLFLDVIHGKKTARPAVWFMRQAGRVLPNYRSLKENHSFAQMMEQPDLAAKVTLMPVDDLGVDAAILFSDILVVPQALGMQLEFTNDGPHFGSPLHAFQNPISQLKPDLSKLDHIYKAIDRVVESRPSNLPLIGFCGGPLTTFCFMFRDNVRDITFKHAIEYIYRNRKSAEKIMDAITDVSVEYALNQVKHGIDTFQLFETYAGLVPEELYLEMVLPFAAKILNAVREKGIPTLYFPKDLGDGISAITCKTTDFIGIDWRMPLIHARKITDPEVGLQGNLDPRLLYAPANEILDTLEKYKEFGQYNHKWIFNLGHGLMPDTPFDNVKLVVDWIKQSNWNR